MVRGDITDLDRARPDAGRARDHTGRAPRRAPGAVLPRRPRARGARQRRRHGQRLRGRQGAARSHPWCRLRQFGRRVRPRRSSPAPESGGTSPATIYGVYKLANEGTARLYHAESGVPSVGIRPYVVYGPGRDQGMTAGPTRRWRRLPKAKASRSATAAARSTTTRPQSAGHSSPRPRRRRVRSSANFPGVRATLPDVVAAIEAAAPEAAGRITWNESVAAVSGGARGACAREGDRAGAAADPGRGRRRDDRPLQAARRRVNRRRVHVHRHGAETRRGGARAGLRPRRRSDRRRGESWP